MYRSTILGILAFFIVSGSLHAVPMNSVAQNYPRHTFFRHPVNDMKAKAMGNTEVLSTSGSNSMFSNPALMSFNEERWSSITFMFMDGSDDMQNHSEVLKIPEDYPYPSRLTDYDYSNDYYNPKVFKSIAFGFSKPIWNISVLSYGFGYQVAHDLRVEYHNRQTWYWDEINHENNYIVASHGEVRTFTPAVSISIKDFIGFGCSFEHSLFDDFSETIINNSNNIDSDGNITDVRYLREDYSGDFSGSTFTYGVVLKIKTVKLGYKYKDRFRYNFEEINGKISGDISDYFVDIDRSMKVPGGSGYSIAWDPMKDLTLVAEYQTREYSSLKSQSLYETVYNYENGDVKRFGLEYRKNNYLSLRCGAFSEAAFMFNNNNGEPQNLNGVTAGVGFRYSFLVIDVASEYYVYEYEVDPATDVANDNWAKVKGSNFNLGLTLSVVI